MIGHGVLVDGYRESYMQSKAKASEALQLSHYVHESSLSYPGFQRSKRYLTRNGTRTTSSHLFKVKMRITIDPKVPFIYWTHPSKSGLS